MVDIMLFQVLHCTHDLLNHVEDALKGKEKNNKQKLDTQKKIVEKRICI